MRDDSGIAMLVVIGVMSIVTVLAVSSFVLARNTLQESERVEDSSRAFRVASSGLEGQISTLTEEAVDLMLDGDAVTGTTEDGAFELTIADLGRNEFELVSRGTGLDGSEEVVRQRFFFLNLWKMNISSGSEDSLITGGNRMNGNSHIVGPFYVKGSLNIQANMSVFEGPLFVKTSDGGIYSANNNFYLGHPDEFIDVYCDTLIIPENRTANNSGVYVRTRSASVPDIMLPPLRQDHLEQWAQKAIQESTDNKMGSTDTDNLESAGEDPVTYKTIQPPNTVTFMRAKASATNDANTHYKFFGASDGTISEKDTGSTHLSIGNSTFGAWGALTDVNGATINSAAGPTGVSSYPSGAHDDFAYDASRNILFISGTVFVDGPVTFTRGMRYVGNGTIVSNGDVTVNGYLRPYGSNTQAQENEWALGIVTPGDINFTDHDSSNPGSPGDPNLREIVTPSWAGAFYTEGIANFPKTNSIFLGSLLAGHMEFYGPNNFIITNPMLPSYLPDSLPGGDLSMLLPTHWSRD